MTRRPTVLSVSAVLAVVIYAGLWAGYRLQWHWLHAVDAGAIDHLLAYGLAHPAWVHFWNVFCTMFGPNGFRVLGAVAVGYAAWQRRVRMVVFVLVCIGASGFISSAAKALAHRPRPADELATAELTSFPSGHAIAVMTGVLALLTVTAGVGGPKLRAAAVALGTLVVIGVGFGRVAVVVHYPSDVVAGWALGYLWFLVCFVLVRPLSKASAETPAAPDSGR